MTRGRFSRGRVAAWLAVLAAAVLLVIGYAGVSAASDQPEQLSYLVSGGIGSLLVLGIGVTLLLTADLADQHRKLAELSVVTRADGAGTRRPGGAAALAAIWAVSGILVYAGWERAATAPDRDGAVPGVTLGVGALVLTAAAASVATLRLRRSVHAVQAHVLPLVAAGLAHVPQGAAGAAGAAGRHGVAPDQFLLTAPGLTRYHLDGCPTLAGIAAVAIAGTPGRALQPCRICEAPGRQGDE